jgi:hypothetical protein
MNQLFYEVEEIVEVLEKLAIGILENDYEEYDYNMSEFAQKMIVTFPRIIKAYSLPEFYSVKEDGKYWSGQLERLLTVLQQKDQFLFVDTLNFETKENLILFKNMIKDMEIDI